MNVYMGGVHIVVFFEGALKLTTCTADLIHDQWYTISWCMAVWQCGESFALLGNAIASYILGLATIQLATDTG